MSEYDVNKIAAFMIVGSLLGKILALAMGWHDARKRRAEEERRRYFFPSAKSVYWPWNRRKP